MTIQGDETAREDEAFDTMPDWLVQWPMIAFTSWWDAVFDAWQPKRCPHQSGECHDLPVPEPIEREGEHALFA